MHWIATYQKLWSVLKMIEIINGECIEGLRKLDSSTVDLIITDPPYNIANFMNGKYTNLQKMRSNFFGAAGWDDLDFNDWKDHMRLFLKNQVGYLRMVLP
ncbi:restriction endonuclease [uncultured Gemella sp.]|uniref:restriction endonuclease n=1 Tax=uncultured Gemella sp. TaxID=254352 RepID=UPI0028EDF793|nr:restriction endonuclease [uncultured Gemella sp.]